MLDAVVAFTRGGEVLWRWRGGSKNKNRGSSGSSIGIVAESAANNSNAPLDALVRSCLLEDRASEPSFNWDAPGVGGGSYTLKWSLHNGLGLVFVAISQRALRLPYVDSLLASTRDAFAREFFSSKGAGSGGVGGVGGVDGGVDGVVDDGVDFSSFDDIFERLADAAERSSSSGAATTTKADFAAAPASAAKKDGDNNKKKTSFSTSSLSNAEVEGAAAAAAGEDAARDGDGDGDGPAINLEAATARLKLANKQRGGSKSSSVRGTGAGAGTGGASAPTRAAKEARVWQGQARKGAALAALDFSDGKPPSQEEGNASTPAASSAEGAEPGDDGGFDLTAKSRVDADDEEDDEEEDFDAGFVFDDDRTSTAPAAAAAPSTTTTKTTKTPTSTPPPPPSSSTGVLSSFVRSLGLSVAGSAALADEDVTPALDALKKKLMERNVAEPVAEKICSSVRASIVGTRHASFTRVASAVRSSVEEALERILTPRRTVDILREIRNKKQQQGGGGFAAASNNNNSRPYVIAFVGVNGVGKSTSLSKIAYWLSSNGVKVSIAACDTFRSGAVEQLKTHAARLRVPLFERGYERDPAKVAAEAVRAAARDGVDCVLVDTAGRMQDNEPLMRALAGLISTNDPDLVLFVGEALVGNDGVDQLTQFNARLLELAPPRNNSRSSNKNNGDGSNNGNNNDSNNNQTNNPIADAAGATVRDGRPCAVDGIVLTKFDTIDDKVGAAVSMVYASGAPVMFVGCGQTYVDLKRLNIRSVVRSLLK